MDIVIVVISVFFFVGICFLFEPCAPKEDGSFMTCHWAGQALAGIAALLTVQSVIRLFVKGAGKKQGMDLAMAATAILAIAVPGHLIRLCMMADMRCHAVMTPFVRVMSVLVFACAVVNIVRATRK